MKKKTITLENNADVQTPLQRIKTNQFASVGVPVYHTWTNVHTQKKEKKVNKRKNRKT